MLTGAPSSHRSQGFAGSTPVGLNGYVAESHWDCASINADPHRSRLKVPLPDDCAVVIPSLGKRLVARSVTDGEESTLHITGGLVVKGLEQPTVFLWQPNSAGFLLNGGKGSGQISQVRYFYRTQSRWFESGRLADAASRLYRRHYDCRGGKNSYTNTSGWDFVGGAMRIIVQEGVHSAGCLQPHTDRNILFEVIGNPITGRIASAREIEKLP